MGAGGWVKRVVVVGGGVGGWVVGLVVGLVGGWVVGLVGGWVVGLVGRTVGLVGIVVCLVDGLVCSELKMFPKAWSRLWPAGSCRKAGTNLRVVGTGVVVGRTLTLFVFSLSTSG